MENKWQFSNEYMENLVNKGAVLLTNPHLSDYKKELIRNDMNTFKRYLMGDFENYQTMSEDGIPVGKLYKYALYKMKKQYETLGEGLIDFIINLDYERIFEVRDYYYQTELSIDSQVKLTLENYEKHSKLYWKYADKMLSQESIPQVQLVEELGCSSYCHYSHIARLPFLIIDPSEFPSITNHETQHGIEFALGIYSDNIFRELGPIYFEMLFTDLLCESQGFLLPGDYGERISDTYFALRYLSEYFEVIKVFATTDFKVSMDKFHFTFLEKMDVPPENIQPYLVEEIISNKIDNDMCYLFSHLKAIELRDNTKEFDGDSFYILEPHITSQVFDFETQGKSFKIYESYVNEMNEKTKKLTF